MSRDLEVVHEDRLKYFREGRCGSPPGEGDLRGRAKGGGHGLFGRPNFDGSWGFEDPLPLPPSRVGNLPPLPNCWRAT
eukprot:6606101-Pyramimonas_sp.AAC.1